jgi:ABC-2 type transport system ATP-binding protein
MVRIDNVVKTYAKGKVRAVDDITLHVRRGEIFGFIGPNGAGKTTTIKMITGILRPDSGTIAIDGLDIQKEAEEAKRRIGFVPDSHELYDRLSGMEYLNFIADVYGVSTEARRASIEKYLSMFNLEDSTGELIRTYSHGMKQKLALVGALLHTPPLWILDEPMTGLDPKASHMLKEEMKSHCARGNTVFFSTHVLEVAERLCDRIGIIDNGRLVAVGTFDELRRGGNDEMLESVFFKLTEAAEGGEE